MKHFGNMKSKHQLISEKFTKPYLGVEFIFRTENPQDKLAL